MLHSAARSRQFDSHQQGDAKPPVSFLETLLRKTRVFGVWERWGDVIQSRQWLHGNQVQEDDPPHRESATYIYILEEGNESEEKKRIKFLRNYCFTTRFDLSFDLTAISEPKKSIKRPGVATKTSARIRWNALSCLSRFSPPQNSWVFRGRYLSSFRASSRIYDRNKDRLLKRRAEFLVNFKKGLLFSLPALRVHGSVR